ncbi:hypothetical protein POG22_11225 [Geitlerinema sp. CS-897]|nr:hypothetical protein [Geitlerinema sp. CS-897]
MLQQQLWLLVLESKSSDFSVNVGIGQALTYMMASPNDDRPIFGAICNGTDFLFLKLVRSASPKYAHFRLFSLLNPENDLYNVLKVLKNIGKALA